LSSANARIAELESRVLDLSTTLPSGSALCARDGWLYSPYTEVLSWFETVQRGELFVGVRILSSGQRLWSGTWHKFDTKTLEGFGARLRRHPDGPRPQPGDLIIVTGGRYGPCVKKIWEYATYLPGGKSVIVKLVNATKIKKGH